jgi:bacterioferritin
LRHRSATIPIPDRRVAVATSPSSLSTINLGTPLPGWLFTTAAQPLAVLSSASRVSRVLHKEASMKGDAKVIEHLNKVLGNELIAINQYFLHYRMYDNWGYKELAEHERAESIDEMKHADRLVERILFLEGLPNLQKLGKLLIGQTPKECIECDLKLERAALPDLQVAIAYCEQTGDYVSRQLFGDIMHSEEEHIDWLETQLGLIEQVGLENYLQTHIRS